MLSEIIGKHPRIKIATQKDNEGILKFFETVAMDVDTITIRYNRAPDFFAFLKVQGSKYVVFIMENDDESVGGVGVMSSRECIVDGKVSMVCYLSDLRIGQKLNKRTRVQWRKSYIEIIENCRKIDELGNPEFLYSAILDDNQAAIRAFTKKNANPIYKKITGYRTVNILGRVSRVGGHVRHFVRKKIGKYTFGFATKSDFISIKEFLYKENKNKKLGYNFTKDGDGELERRLKDWPEFDISSFFLVKDNEEIVGLIAPWGSSTLRKLVVDEASLPYRILGQMMPIWGRDRVAKGKELKVLYLTTIEIESSLSLTKRAKLFASMLDELYYQRIHTDYHIVSFMDFEECSFRDEIKWRGYITSHNDATLYQVMSHDDFKNGNLLESGSEEVVGFDLGIA